ncbi:hypothetical protein ACH495_14070 [Micromonospora sp. NPDC018662]|uniref:hypothetical protein n=1 Tax=Micromonospora sp. NPDC018662 TaxID=3364238 RepID=UPI00378B99A5
MSTLMPQAWAQVTAGLHADGWSVTSDDEAPTFTREAHGELRYQLQVSLTERRAGLSMLPSVGVEHQTEARLFSRFLGLAEEAEAGVCMVGRTLPDLLPTREDPPPPYGRWLGRDRATLDEAVAQVRDDIRRHAMPFLASFRTMQDVIRSASGETSRQQNDEAHLAIAWALEGQTDEALTALDRFAGQARTQPPFVAEQSWAFVRRFINHFDVSQRSTLARPSLIR